MKNQTVIMGLTLVGLALCSNIRADIVTEWNTVLGQAIQATPDPPPTGSQSGHCPVGGL